MQGKVEKKAPGKKTTSIGSGKRGEERPLWVSLGKKKTKGEVRARSESGDSRGTYYPLKRGGTRLGGGKLKSSFFKNVGPGRTPKEKQGKKHIGKTVVLPEGGMTTFSKNNK